MASSLRASTRNHKLSTYKVWLAFSGDLWSLQPFHICSQLSKLFFVCFWKDFWYEIPGHPQPKALFEHTIMHCKLDWHKAKVDFSSQFYTRNGHFYSVMYCFFLISLHSIKTLAHDFKSPFLDIEITIFLLYWNENINVRVKNLILGKH